MAVTAEWEERVLALLNETREVSARAMFGGAGVYSEGFFFACMDRNRLYFKVDDRNRPDYEKAGMGPFAPMGPDRPMMSYYEVPPTVIEDPARLARWMERSIEVARDTKKPAKAPKGKRA